MRMLRLKHVRHDNLKSVKQPRDLVNITPYGQRGHGHLLPFACSLHAGGAVDAALIVCTNNEG